MRCVVIVIVGRLSLTDAVSLAHNGSGLYEVGEIKAQMFVKALMLIRITKVWVKHFRPNFIKPLLSASAVFKVGSFKF